MTTSEPRIEERPERPYVAVRADLTMDEIETGGVESFLTDPTEELDPSRWETEVAILLRLPA